MGCDSLCWCLTWKPSPLGWTLLPDLQHGHLQHVWRRCPGGGLRGGKGVGDVLYVQEAVKISGSCQKLPGYRPIHSGCGSGRHELDHRLRAVWALQSTRSSTCRTRSLARLLLFTHCGDGSKFKKQWTAGFGLVVECESSSTVTKFNPFPFAIFNPLVYIYICNSIYNIDIDLSLVVSIYI